MLLGAGFSTYLFFDHVSMYIHGPLRFVSGLYDKASDPKAIVYEAGPSFFSYFPLAFAYDGRIAQFKSAEVGDGVYRLGQTEKDIQAVESAVAPYKTLLLVDVFERRFDALRRCQADSRECQFPAAAVEARLLGSGQWKEVSEDRSFGVYDTQVKVLQKVMDESSQGK
jgi:hypothetical protein